jgi:hypothetical protein
MAMTKLRHYHGWEGTCPYYHIESHRYRELIAAIASHGAANIVPPNQIRVYRIEAYRLVLVIVHYRIVEYRGFHFSSLIAIVCYRAFIVSYRIGNFQAMSTVVQQSLLLRFHDQWALLVPETMPTAFERPWETLCVSSWGHLPPMLMSNTVV